ncbi:hypothetical protein N7474_006037 [Penicillium riverlandense]|uniref:uncharacterized protein n=1 Tax=Penicillium riverlandense TaxID=1903569 RepID=UPI0025482618|nr:uncharacterized protein N7474_006037 [Penicillium riverlandense]KAJ5820446.1 hypothetical protein N7474_006037 [Penicillium riverlandense]
MENNPKQYEEKDLWRADGISRVAQFDLVAAKIVPEAANALSFDTIVMRGSAMTAKCNGSNSHEQNRDQKITNPAASQ